MQTVLITGGAGFIGSHIVEKLLAAGYKAVVADNLSSGSLSNLPSHRALRLYKLDVTADDLDSVFAQERPDYVIHLSAQTSVVRSVADPLEDARQNILGSVRVTELCKKYGVKKLLAASSAAVYGAPQYLPVDEKHPVNPLSPYGLSKYVMEQYIRLSGVPYIVFRFANVYGPRQSSSKESGVIAIFHKALSDGNPLYAYGDGAQIRDYVYVEDIADICVKALGSKVQNETVNVATQTGVSVNRLFALMKEIYASSAELTHLPPRAGEIKDSVLCNKKALDLFAGLEFRSLQEGLKHLAGFKGTKV